MHLARTIDLTLPIRENGKSLAPTITLLVQV